MKTIYSSISKRVFSLLVALIMAISTVPFAAASAFAQEQGISITTSTITPNTKSIEVTLAQGITTGFAKVIQLDSGEEYDTTKLFSYTDLSGVIGYTALNEGSNTITLTTAPTEGKEVIAVLHDRSSGEMQEYTSAPITVTASEGSSGGETTKPTQAEILAGCEVTIDGFADGKITEDATSLTANVKLHSSVKSCYMIVAVYPANTVFDPDSTATKQLYSVRVENGKSYTCNFAGSLLPLKVGQKVCAYLNVPVAETKNDVFYKQKQSRELTVVDKNGEGQCYTCMGCRSFLTPYVDPETGKPKYYGRFNQGVVTINLVDVALSSGGNFDKFWKIFDERLALCHRALQARHKRLLGTPSDAAPILWQYGALARLKKGEKIDKLLFGGYSTISLGYAGLYECVKYMTGKSHTDAGAKPFALSVMQHMNDKCNEWKKAENMDYSLYGTPLESTTYKFAKCLQKRFGIVPGITDKNYITNSYHVHVSEHIDAFTKLKFESEFQKLSPGGAISYVEVPNMQDNLEAVMSVLQFIYDNIMYAELNTKSDYCQCCGYDGEIKIVEDDGKLVWECPKCGNRDQNKLNVARRTCGYIGTQFWNQGRTQEIKDRVLHL
mgnify:CR=1 FL=1